MDNLDLIVGVLSIGLVTMVVASRREYSKAKKWLSSHQNINPCFYRQRLKESRVSALDDMNYYLGFLGRKLAQVAYAKKGGKDD